MLPVELEDRPLVHGNMAEVQDLARSFREASWYASALRIVKVDSRPAEVGHPRSDLRKRP